jgi:hypothetical protein
MLLCCLGFVEVLEIEVPNRQSLWVWSRSSATRGAVVSDPILRLLTEPHYSARYLTLKFQCGPPVSSLALSELLIKCENHYIKFGRRCILTSEYLRMIQADCGPPHHERSMTLDISMESLSEVDPGIVTDFLRNCPPDILLRCGSNGIRRLSATLVGETSVQLLYLSSETGDEDSSSDLSCFFRALSKFKNLANLQLNGIDVSDENWSILCQSVARHPALQILEMDGTMPNATKRESKERKTRRTKEMLAMLKGKYSVEIAQIWSRYVRRPNPVGPH